MSTKIGPKIEEEEEMAQETTKKGAERVQKGQLQTLAIDRAPLGGEKGEVNLPWRELY